MTDTPSTPGGEGNDHQPGGTPPLPPAPPPFQPQGQPSPPPPPPSYPPQGEAPAYVPSGQAPYPPQAQYPPAPGGFQAAPPPQFGDQPMFGSAPKPPLPASVANAVKLMYVGAALSALGLIIGLLSSGSIRKTVEKNNPSYSASKVNSIVHAEIAVIVIGALIGITLWLWIARKLKAGRQWARVTGTVFFGLNTLALLGSLASGTGAVSKISGFVSWAVGLVIVVLIWRKESSAYFSPKPPPQQNW